MRPHDLSARDLIDAYRRKSLSPVEVIKDVLEHVAACEPHVRAAYALDPSGALAAARASEERWRRGEPLGALDGVPITIKENIATKGVAVPLGTAASLLSPAQADAPPAARVREAGAIIFSKTTMPDYGMLSSGVSSFHGLTRNPWDLSKNPGGSSAGAGAAAALGYGPLHIGTDIGGSVRLPAGWCGIFALKPSLGRVPIDPPYMGRVAGPMTRDVADSALLMSVLAQPDARDFMSLPAAAIKWNDLERDVKGLRLGLMLDVGCGLPVEPEVEAAIREGARKFEAAGAHVEIMQPFLTRAMLAGLDRFWRIRAWTEIGEYAPERRAKILPFIAAWAEGGAGLSAKDAFNAYSATMTIRAATIAACAPYDFVLSPTAPMPAYGAELPCPTNDPARPLEQIIFTYPFSMSEQPAASVNCGYTRDGLPIGLQIIGQRFDDLGVLQMSRAFELMRGAQRPWPQVYSAL